MRNLRKREPINNKLESSRNPLAIDEIDEAWRLYSLGKLKGNGDGYRNQLIMHYRYLVRYTAERMRQKFPSIVVLDDLISAGNFGLMDAIDSYDPNRGVLFETYSRPRIRGAILDELRYTDWVPRLVRARAHQLKRLTERVESLYGRNLTYEELQAESGLNTEQFERLCKDSHAIKLLQLNHELNEGEPDESSFSRSYENERAQNPTIKAQKDILKELLTKGLTRAERLVIVLYYYEEMTMKEIGRTLDLSESRVSQMHSSILARLKANLSRRGNLGTLI